jgi:hypothetical protein
MVQGQREQTATHTVPVENKTSENKTNSTFLVLKFDLISSPKKSLVFQKYFKAPGDKVQSKKFHE